MTTTVSHFTPETGVAAEETAAVAVEPTAPGLRRARVARARPSVTQGAGRKVVASVTGAWVWRDAPPSLQEIISARVTSADAAPDDRMRAGWLVWNFAVAIPLTALLYAVAWVLQHPARTALAGLVSAPIVFIWIK